MDIVSWIKTTLSKYSSNNTHDKNAIYFVKNEDGKTGKIISDEVVYGNGGGANGVVVESQNRPTGGESVWVNPDEDTEEVEVYNRSQVDALHQSIVNSITSLSEAGYLFSGVATSKTDPGTLDAKVFYIANGKDIYDNFGGLEVTEDDVVILYYDTAWHKVSTGIASQEKLITLADEEDITRNVDGKLQFKDRAYGGGMGYVILRKDKTFAEQVTQANTIYEIRYDFNLGKNITVPENCVLKFDGGSLSNGEIVGDVQVLNPSYLVNKNKVFVEGYNLNDEEVLVAENIGMIPDDSSAAIINGNILKKVIQKKKNLYLDKTYYISNTSAIEVDYSFTMSGKGTLILDKSSYLFKPVAGCSLLINGITIKNGWIITNSNLSEQINDIILENCTFINTTRVMYVIGQDISYEETPFGIHNLIVSNCNFEVDTSSFVISDIVIDKSFLIKNNKVSRFQHCFINHGSTNDKTYASTNLKYCCPTVIDGNTVIGTICNNMSYYTFVLSEANVVIYKNNTITNCIGIGDSVTYDGYISAKEYYLENNVFRNVCQLPSSGKPYETPSELFKSKSAGTVRQAKNNCWYIDFDECRSILAAQNITFTDEQFEAINHVSIFGFVHTIDLLDFQSNKIEIKGGYILGYLSSGPIVEAIVKNNYISVKDIKNILLPSWNSVTKRVVFNNNTIYTDGEARILSNYNPQSPLNNAYIEIKNNTSTYAISHSSSSTNTQIIENNYAEKGLSSNKNFYPGDLTMNSVLEVLNQNWTFIPYTLKGIIKMYIPAVDSQYSTIWISKIDVDINFKRSGINLRYKLRYTNGTIMLYNPYNVLVRSINSKVTEFIVNDANVLIAMYNSGTNYTVNIENKNDNDVVTALFANPELCIFGTNDIMEAGTSIYDSTLGKTIYWNGTKWVDEKGYTAAINRGTTAQRPTDTLTTDDAGYEYFDTTLGLPIYLKVTESTKSWVKADGADV